MPVGPGAGRCLDRTDSAARIARKSTVVYTRPEHRFCLESPLRPVRFRHFCHFSSLSAPAGRPRNDHFCHSCSEPGPRAASRGTPAKRRFPGRRWVDHDPPRRRLRLSACQSGLPVQESRNRAKAGQEFHNFAMESGVKDDKSGDSGQESRIPGCLAAGPGRSPIPHFCDHVPEFRHFSSLLSL